MERPPRQLVVRVDASAKIGMGHFMRCLALAEAWCRGGGHAIFAMSEVNATIEAKCRSIGALAVKLDAPRGSLDEARETAALAQQHEARWIVADGYEFAPGYQQALRAGEARLLFIDDDGRYPRYESDLVLNQNIHASPALYPARASHTSLLLGPAHALLRSQFSGKPPTGRATPPLASKLLVTMGGSDPAQATEKVIDALNHCSVHAVIVVGGSNPRRAEIEALARASAADVEVVHDAPNMREFMEWADVAISAAGSTTLELAYIGVPTLMLILADNQVAVAEGMHASGAARNLGWATDVDAATIAAALDELLSNPDQREAMTEAGQRLVDGQGAQRVAGILAAPVFILRPVTMDDATLLFEWTNDAAVRAVSFSSEPISWPVHEQWLRGKLADPNAVLLMAEDEKGHAYGIARFHIENGVATISVSIAASRRGQGLGKRLIEQSSTALLERSDVSSIRALVKADNTASQVAFLAAGFQNDSAATTDEALVFVYPRSH